MAFQFPVAPTVGQVFSPAAGVSYKWNGTGWSPMAAQAAMLNPDGTVTAPGIAWASEPSAGWYRTPTIRNYAVGGTRLEFLGVDTAAPGFTTFQLDAPLANGQTTLSLNNSPSTSSVYRTLYLRNASTGYVLAEYLQGGATALPLTLGFPAGVTSTGPVRFADGSAAAPALSWTSEPGMGFFRTGANAFAASNGNGEYFVFARNSQTHSYLSITGGIGQGLTLLDQLPLTVRGLDGAVAGIGFVAAPGTYGGFKLGIQVKDGYGLAIGAQSAAGPAGLQGFAFYVSHDGNCGARAFNTATFAATNVTPMTGALSDVLKLRGVRCFNTETQRPDIRLEVEDIELAFPELMTESRSPDGTTVIVTGINYMALAAPIVEAIRELHNRVTTLETNGIPVPR